MPYGESPGRPRGSFKDSKGEPKYQVQKIHERHHLMIRMKVLGYGNKQIAEKIGVTPQNVSDVLNSTIAQQQVKAMEAAAGVGTISMRKRLELASPKALDLLEKIRDGVQDGEEASISLRASVSQDLLDRNPESSKHHEAGSLTIPVTAEILAEALVRASEAKGAIAEAEDVPFEEIGEPHNVEVQAPPQLQQAQAVGG